MPSADGGKADVILSEMKPDGLSSGIAISTANGEELHWRL
jgi:hypothetical protein